MNEELKAKIVGKRQQILQHEEDVANGIEASNLDAIQKIRNYAPELKELKEIADQLTECLFTLGEMKEQYSPEFVTNWWSHHIGFFAEEWPSSFGNPNNIYHAKGFGKMNGGACGDVDLFIDTDGIIKTPGRIWENGYMADVHAFADGFPEFKRKFLAYVEKKFF